MPLPYPAAPPPLFGPSIIFQGRIQVFGEPWTNIEMVWTRGQNGRQEVTNQTAALQGQGVNESR